MLSNHRYRSLRHEVISALLAFAFASAGLTAWAQSEMEGRPWIDEPPPGSDYEDSPQHRVPAPEGERMGWQGNVLFNLDSARLKPEYEPFLDSIDQAMGANPDVDLLITGHADHIGDLDYNRRLAERRAESVKRHLVNRGIDPQRIVTRTVGEQRPVAASETEEDRRRNRRADLAFFPAGSEPPPPGELVIGDTEPGRGPPPGPSYRGLPVEP